MAILKLFTGRDFNLRHFKFRTQLDGTFFRFEVHYNRRLDTYQMDLFDDADNPIVLAVRLVLGTDLLARFRYKPIPPGKIQMIDSSGAELDAGEEDLGGRVLFLYEEA